MISVPLVFKLPYAIINYACLAPKVILHAFRNGGPLKMRYNGAKRPTWSPLNAQSRDESRFILRAKQMGQTVMGQSISI